MLFRIIQERLLCCNIQNTSGYKTLQYSKRYIGNKEDMKNGNFLRLQHKTFMAFCSYVNSSVLCEALYILCGLK